MDTKIFGIKSSTFLLEKSSFAIWFFKGENSKKHIRDFKEINLNFTVLHHFKVDLTKLRKFYKNVVFFNSIFFIDLLTTLAIYLLLSLNIQKFLLFTLCSWTNLLIHFFHFLLVSAQLLVNVEFFILLLSHLL